jgi:chemotaxis protein histidine kinase CheA
VDSPDVQAKRAASTEATVVYAEQMAAAAAARKAVSDAEKTSNELKNQLASKKVAKDAQEKIAAFLKQKELGEDPAGTESMDELRAAAAKAKATFKQDDALFTALKKETKAESARLKDIVEQLKLAKNLAVEALKKALDGEANPSDTRKQAQEDYKENVRLEKEAFKEKLQALKELEKADEKDAKEKAKAKAKAEKKAIADRQHECYYTKCAIHVATPARCVAVVCQLGKYVLVWHCCGHGSGGDARARAGAHALLRRRGAGARGGRVEGGTLCVLFERCRCREHGA